MIFTIGYEGLGIERFLEILRENRVRTLLDCRYDAISRNPDFSKSSLTSHLERIGIQYRHLKEYGIPREIRKSGNALYWYMENVKPKIDISLVELFEQPVCFMCMERNSASCHRKVILDTMREQGIDGRELSN
jgi:uncharacterized protein (DUF488 family)